jgi:hypothetical protein|nr:MAG TPA: hypothetical protein [Caudoviricetes sp.]
MNNVIYKYQIENTPEQSIMLPKGAKILSVGTQNGRDVSMWAAVNPNNELEERRLIVIETGVVRRRIKMCCGQTEEVTLSFDESRFIGTVLLFEGRYVLHIFEA